jgi:hypothetical protein
MACLNQDKEDKNDGQDSLRWYRIYTSYLVILFIEQILKILIQTNFLFLAIIADACPTFFAPS